MKHIVIGTLFALIVLLLGGCTVIKDNPSVFGNWIGKPITGERAKFAHAELLARTGDVSALNAAWQREYSGNPHVACLPTGWSSRSTTLDWEWRNPPAPTGRFYSYMGKVYMIPAKGTSAYRDYLWKTKQK
jgi:hypothetical protein